MSRREPIVSDTKQRILAAAMEAFGQRGYRGATIEDGAASAGLSITSSTGGESEAAMAVVAQIVHSFALPRTVAS